MNKALRLLSLAFLVLTLGGNLVAQAQNNEETCAAIVQQAIDQANQVCTGLGQNEVCYGHNAIQSLPISDATEIQFSQAGDIESLLDVQSLRLSPYDELAEVWGVVQMALQASLPDGSAESVQAVLFGHVAIEDEAEGGAPPMSAFTFQSGSNDSPCAAAPPSGMLIQTPEGVGQVRMLVNEVVVNLGSTGFMQSQPGGFLSLTVIEGSGGFGDGENFVPINEGEQGQIPMGENNQPNGEPTVGEGQVNSNTPGFEGIGSLLNNQVFEGDGDGQNDGQDNGGLYGFDDFMPPLTASAATTLLSVLVLGALSLVWRKSQQG